MSFHRFIIEISYEDANFDLPPSSHAVAEIIKAGLYKTYANPARTDAGVSSVAIFAAPSFGYIGEGENARPTYTRGKEL